MMIVACYNYCNDLLGSSKQISDTILPPLFLCSTHRSKGILLSRRSNMKEIKLTQGKVALVSDHQYERANQYKWHARETAASTWYATRNGKRTIFGREKPIQLHRFLMDVTDPSIEVDHIDGNGLNCQDENLRECTHAQNMHNYSRPRNNTTGYKGVSKMGGRYCSHINVDRVMKHLGSFGSAEEAARAYDEAAKKYHGEFAKLNF